MDHEHGSLICLDCKSIISPCKCLPPGEEAGPRYAVCPSCRAERAYKTSQQTYELNQKLQEMGVSAIPKRKE